MFEMVLVYLGNARLLSIEQWILVINLSEKLLFIIIILIERKSKIYGSLKILTLFKLRQHNKTY